MRNLALGALALLAVAGCARSRTNGGGAGGSGGGNGNGKPPVSLAVTPATTTVALQAIGNAKFSGSAQLVATATYADGSTADVSAAATWSAADPTATVSNGDVTLSAVGQSKVTATLATARSRAGTSGASAPRGASRTRLKSGRPSRAFSRTQRIGSALCPSFSPCSVLRHLD